MYNSGPLRSSLWSYGAPKSMAEKKLETGVIHPEISGAITPSITGDFGPTLSLLRTFQYIPGTYPKPPISGVCRTSFHLGVGMPKV